MTSGPVLELRQYTTRGGRRDALIALFEREFIEPQDALGAQVLGIFRDLDDPDRFVWLRGFAGMGVRAAALEAFYGGPIWKAHSAAANATMLDSDNVLLLRPAGAGAALPAPANEGGTAGVLRVAIHSLREVDSGKFAAYFQTALAPCIARSGGAVLGSYISEPAPNNFPRLPVRERDPVFVWFARLPTAAAERGFSERLAAESGWRDGASEAVLPALMRKPEVLRLTPTARSPLR